MENNSYKKIYIILAQDLFITSHTTYPKIGYRGPMDFELWQS
jgi:hypothetical protein